MFVVVGLSSTDLNSEYFGRRFNQQPIAIFDVPEPSDTGKALAEFYLDMHHLGQRGIYLESEPGKAWLHKPFLKGHLADAVAR
jgi:hypothetical protein